MDDDTLGSLLPRFHPEALSFLTDPGLDPLFWQAERIGEPSAWWRHVPFAHWIVQAAAPRTLVELGTHAGVSYSAFCHAVLQAGLPTRCWAVDTWQGDEHAGAYGDEIFAGLKAFHDTRYQAFSGLLRCSFDAALSRFPDQSIDLLHIDGFHTYDAVRHDFESWKPKLSDRAVVLFHDTNVLEGDFGVWRLWAELRDQYPTFEFLHAHGLGVLGFGNHLPPAVASLLHIDPPAAVARLRARFAWTGERWLAETRERMLATKLRVQEEAARTAAGTHETELHAVRRDAAAAQEASDAARAAAQEASDAARQHAEMLQREVDTVATRQALAEAEVLQHAAEAARWSVQVAEHLAARRAAERQVEVVEAMRRQSAHRADRARADAEAAVDAVRSRLANAEALVAAISNSTAWRATGPLRRAGRSMPAGVRRGLRRAAKLVWWSVSLNLGQRLAQRRATIQAINAAPMLQPAPVARVLDGYDPAMAPSQRAPEEAKPSRIERRDSESSGDRAMRLVYVSGENDTPGHRYRVERPAAAARALGAKVTVVPMATVGDALHEIAAADVLILWRTFWSDGIAQAVETARSASAKVVFDIDDLMVDPTLARLDVIDGIRTQHLTEQMVAEHYARVRQTMLAADLCIASTEELASHMRDAWLPARVLPNGFDHGTLKVSRQAARRWAHARDGLVRIGYAGGSRTHQRDFGLCAEAVGRVLRTFPQARLVAFRSADNSAAILDVEEFPELRGLEQQIEWRTFVPLEQLPEEMARFDINLVPLEVGNPFCEAKSELKFFEAALVDVPTIASPTGPYCRAIRHGETGFLAGSPDQWHEALFRLLDDPALRARTAAAARRDVLWTFGPERRVEEMANLLDYLRHGQSAARAFELDVLRQTAPARLRAAAPRIPAHSVVLDLDNFGLAQITIIVPLYNYAEFVTEALDSVAQQTLRDIDLIIVDDASTDNSLAVALGWAEANAPSFNRIRVVRNLANAGLGLTRNVAFDLADTPWVLPLDADNRLAPRCAEECLRVAAGTTAAYVYPVIQQFGEKSERMGLLPYDPVRLSNGNYIDAMALISRAAWAVVGGYDHVVGGWEDFDLWCRFAERGLRGERVSGEPLAEYRVHGASMIHAAIGSAERMDAMMADLKRRHPWLTLSWPLSVPRPSALAMPALHAVDASAHVRLNGLLPILRCPTSGGRLSLAPDATSLISETGIRWPLVAGRPNLFAGMSVPQMHLETHVSNPLPETARALIRNASGPVLHLSAGGSAERFANVVEVEAAIFRHTDVLADAHHLPFADGTFEAVVAMNAFEHYRDPPQAAREILRVLAPGGRVLIRTAFLQPEHEAPWHFYNCTRFGLEAWFEGFETEVLRVSENFHPGHSIAWLASECEAALRSGLSQEAADTFARAPFGDFIALWRTAEDQRMQRRVKSWSDLAALPQREQQKVAAGFEFLGRKPS